MSKPRNLPELARPEPTAPSWWRRWRRRLICGLLILLLLLWAAPKIVAWTPLRDWLAQKIFARVDGTIHVGGASLGWFSPVVLHDVTVTDRGGGKLLHLARLESGNSLLSLACNRQALGRFRLERPEVNVQLTATGSNLEDALAKYFAGSEPARAPGRASRRTLDLEVVDGTIQVRDETTRTVCRFESVAATVALAPDTDTPVRIDLKAECVAEQTRGRLELHGSVRGAARASGECKLEGEGLPLAVLNPLLRRLGVALVFSGDARAKAIYRWSRDTVADDPRVQLEADVGAERVSVSGAWLAGDRIELGKVTLPIRLAAVGSRLHIDEARLDCGLGQASVRGGIDAGHGLEGWLQTAGCSISADVDLARLANQLPNALRLQPGTQLTAGRLLLSCQSQRHDNAIVWEGKLKTTALEGRRGGKPLRWPEPVTVDFRARTGGEGLPVFDSLVCQSRFLRVQGSGSAQQLTLRADMDLKELAQPLSQFVDLGDLHLAGQGAAQVAVRAVASGRYTVDAGGRFQNLHVAHLAEPIVAFKLAGVWRSADDVFDVSEGFLQSSALSGKVKGRVTQLGGRKDVELQGTLAYDTQKLEQQLRPYLGAGVKVSGLELRPFRVGGALNPPGPRGVLAGLTGETGLAFKALRSYGAEVGPTEIHIQLADGWLQARPITTTLSKGQLRLEPSVRLDPGPVELHLKPGQVLQRAQITPAMGAGALAYALPPLAGVTEAQGELSLRIDSAQIPLAAPERSEIAGTLSVHSARVGATPLIRELGVLFKVPPLGVQVRDAVVPFRMADGKVHHKDLELIFAEMTIRTSGWVGVDGSLSLVAEMPIPPRWVGAGKLSAALAKQRIQIPIRGTLDRPRLDEPALRAAMTRFVKDSAGNLLQQELDNRLKKLMPK